MSVARLFLDQSQTIVRGEWLPKIERALDVLGEDGLWWRPNDATNSAGTLCVHLAGNVRQWIVAGVGGAADIRDRPGEFATTGGRSRAEVLADLRTAVDEACRVIDRLDDDALARRYPIQGRKPTGLGAVYHVAEHFAMHAGQIVWIAKARSGVGLGFYDDTPDGLAALRWVPTPAGPLAP